jgi:hypothetical protein
MEGGLRVMRNPTIDEVVGADQVQSVTAPHVPEVEGHDLKGIGLDFSFLKAETGEGSIDQYLEHPLNFNNSKPMARVIRGLTGMFDNLNLAIIDIVIGGLEYVKGRRSTSAETQTTDH